MPIANESSPQAFPSEYLDRLAQCSSEGEAFRRTDEIRRLIAPGSIFSIQQNVTTADDPDRVIRLRRIYSSEKQQYPIDSVKKKMLTPWTERVLLRGLPFIGEGAEVLALNFDDYEQMRTLGLQTVVNVPLMERNTCWATFNVFGVRARWEAREVLGIQLLALAVSRWVPRSPDLHYRVGGYSHSLNLNSSQET